MCPMWRHLYGASQSDTGGSNLKSQTEIEKIVREYFELKNSTQINNKRLTEIKIDLLGFMDAEKIERVFGENGYLTKNITERTLYDMDKIKEILGSKILELSSKKQTVSLKMSRKKILKKK